MSDETMEKCIRKELTEFFGKEFVEKHVVITTVSEPKTTDQDPPTKDD